MLCGKLYECASSYSSTLSDSPCVFQALHLLGEGPRCVLAWWHAPGHSRSWQDDLLGIQRECASIAKHTCPSTGTQADKHTNT